MLAHNISHMTKRHLPQVLRIERVSVDCPWTVSDFVRALRHRNVRGFVAEEPGDGEVLGYLLYEWLDNSLEVLTFAVKEGSRRRGVGSALMEKAAGKLGTGRVGSVWTVVSERNVGAQVFLRSNGFVAWEVLREACEVDVDDAYHFVRYAGDKSVTLWPHNRVVNFYEGVM